MFNFAQTLSCLSVIVPDSLWHRVEESVDRKNGRKKIEAARRRLSSEYENLIKSINRSRLAAETIKLENTEDEGDLATISHEREFLYDLHEGSFARLRFIQQGAGPRSIWRMCPLR
jgi:hypothetical protein